MAVSRKEAVDISTPVPSKTKGRRASEYDKDDNVQKRDSVDSAHESLKGSASMDAAISTSLRLVAERSDAGAEIESKEPLA